MTSEIVNYGLTQGCKESVIIKTFFGNIVKLPTGSHGMTHEA